MSKNTKIILAFVAGQFVQVVAHILSKVSYMNKPVLFCVAAGFLILVAVVSGMYLGVQEETAKKPKSYKDYAQAGGNS